MQHRTYTALGALRIGDIFHYPKQDEKYQVQSHTTSHTYINRPDGSGGFIGKYDEAVTKKKGVIFLRHTRPEPGEQCFVMDLQPGEVFHTISDVITEYVKDTNGMIVRTDGQDAPVMKREDRVIFIRTQFKAH